MNSRHPGPRRVWKGGSEPRLLTPDNRDPLDPWDPAERRMSSKSCIFRAPVGKNVQDVALALCFFVFLGQPHAKHILFRSFSAESLPRMLSKPIIPLGTSLKKSKKRKAIASGAWARAWARARAQAQAHKGAQIPQRQPKSPPKTREPCFNKKGERLVSENKSPAGNCAH